MSKKDELKSEVMSNIDDDIIEKSTKKRAALWGKSPKNNKKLWMTVAAAAACFAIILAAIVVFLPSVGKQIPIYQGMTVSSEAPVTQNSDALASNGMTLMSVGSGLGYSFEMLDEKDHGVGNNNGNGVVGNGENKDESDERGEGGNILEDAVNDSFISAESQEGMYYAKKNEDIYIYVHISNPDGFEILSFTLNGVKYSSYMFEEGSDLETLVLKVNVGDDEGVQEYTIDAIKYVDGEKIKDVIMDGDTTIEVLVGSSDQNVSFNERFEGRNLIIDPTWSDSFEGEKEFLSLAVYDGEKVFRELDPGTTLIEGLPMDSKLLLVATYNENGKTITKKSVIQTPKQSEGLIVLGGKVIGRGTCTDTELYINMPIGKEAFFEDKTVEKVYLGDGVTSIGERAFASCSSLTSITIPDSVTSIGAEAFQELSSLTSITIGNGVTSIGEYAFSGCSSLTSITIGNGVTSIGEYAFAGCSSLTSITIPDSVTSIGDFAFYVCSSLTSITIPDSVTSLGSHAFTCCRELYAVHIENVLIKIEPSQYIQVYDPATESFRAGLAGTVFEECPLLSDVYFDGTLEQWSVATSKIASWIGLINDITVHCSDGYVVISNYC